MNLDNETNKTDDKHEEFDPGKRDFKKKKILDVSGYTIVRLLLPKNLRLTLISIQGFFSGNVARA